MRSAMAAEARDLAGWWIAIDRLFPQIYETETIVPMEELLIVDHAGQAENRLMMFGEANTLFCRDKKVCSDAPVTARGSIRSPATSSPSPPIPSLTISSMTGRRSILRYAYSRSPAHGHGRCRAKRTDDCWCSVPTS
jgi:hypothetical protein